jgi:transcriptional antiterminator NusG
MEKNWYVVHTYSGFEEKVKISLEHKIQKRGLEDRIERILIPTEKVIEVRGGKKREAQKKFYPGYILVRMQLDDDTWHLVRNIPRVTGFVGGTKPLPIPEEEIEQILQQLERGASQPQVKTQFETGEQVRITDGPFANFIGSVEEVDMEHGKLRVMVSIFSRQTPVELHFFQVEKEES